MQSLARQRGLSLIELMVAVLIGLAAMVAVFQTFAVSEGQRRTALSGGDASFNGLIGYNVMQRDAKSAGFGLNAPALLGCTVDGWDGATSPARTFSFVLAPLSITQGAGNAPDQVTFAYGSAESVVAPVRVQAAPASVDALYSLQNAFGVTAGDVLLMAEAGRDCLMSTATNTPLAAVPPTVEVARASGTYSDSITNNAAALARYNRPAGSYPSPLPTRLTFSQNARVINLGRMPVVRSYYLANNTLLSDDVLTGVNAQPVAAQIVQLQAEYGLGSDTNADGVADTVVWSTTTPTTAVDWANVLAMRMAVVARSAVRERANATGVCDATTAAPTWGDGQTLDLSADAEWQCYRYRVFESTISLRNQIWRPA
jgi:type IV pilus assembly protein PilW